MSAKGRVGPWGGTRRSAMAKPAGSSHRRGMEASEINNLSFCSYLRVCVYEGNTKSLFRHVQHLAAIRHCASPPKHCSL